MKLRNKKFMAAAIVTTVQPQNVKKNLVPSRLAFTGTVLEEPLISNALPFVGKIYGTGLVQGTFFFISRRTYLASCEFLIVVTTEFTFFWGATLF